MGIDPSNQLIVSRALHGAIPRSSVRSARSRCAALIKHANDPPDWNGGGVMPSRVKTLTGESLEKRLAAGFASGEGANYKPALRTCDVPTDGTASIIMGWRHGREHHLLSTGETHYFYVLEWSDDVLEIREQFYLPLAKTVEIARRIGVRHPRVNNEYSMITTDFRIFRRNGGQPCWRARTYKPAGRISARVLEKFEIERIYWLENGEPDWGLVTEEDIPPNVWRNVRWVHECYWVQKLFPISAETIAHVRLWMSYRLDQMRWVRIDVFCQECDSQLKLPRGTALKVLRHLIARKMILVDITQRLWTNVPVQLRAALL
jgi:hypothetical protein